MSVVEVSPKLNGFKKIEPDLNGSLKPEPILNGSMKVNRDVPIANGKPITNGTSLVNESSKTNGHFPLINGYSENHFITHSNCLKIEDPLPKENGVHILEKPDFSDKETTLSKVASKLMGSKTEHFEGEYLNGPDQIIPTEALYTSDAHGVTKLKIEKDGTASLPPISVPTLLTRTADQFPDQPALAVKRDDKWQKWTYKQYLADVRTAAKGFIKLGLEPLHAVCILGFNSPEWFFSDFGAIFAGGFAAGIYTTNSSEACYYCAENSQANIFVVEDKKQLDKVLSFKDRLPCLKAIIQYTGEPEDEGVLSWKQFMEIGSKVPDSTLEERLKRIAINQCCTLIYTSGTTGNPKGVMLSHDNLTWCATSITNFLDFKVASEVFVSYLPLSHVAAQMAEFLLPLYSAGEVYFADRNALKGTLVQTLQEVRPTKFLGVPRVWEKVHEKMMDVARNNGSVKKAIASWAKGLGLKYYSNKMKGNNSVPFCFGLANAIVFKKVKQALGLDRCDLNITGAAPIAADEINYFLSLNIPLMEVYGMSECTSAQTLCIPSAFRVGSVGRTLPGMSTKLSDVDKDGNGEVCMGGRQVFMGYLRMKDKTVEAVDDDGWLHSGDVGRIDKDGFLFITGRIKELIITAGAENVAPVLIEDNVKAELPCVSNCMLIGDRRKYLTMLITLKTDVDGDTAEPLDRLSPATRAWCKDIGCTATTLSEILAKPDEKVMNAIQKGIDRANAKSVSNAQRIQKFRILAKDFSIPGGELGPTLKLKRNVVSDMYSTEIESMYK